MCNCTLRRSSSSNTARCSGRNPSGTRTRRTLGHAEVGGPLVDGPGVDVDATLGVRVHGVLVVGEVPLVERLDGGFALGVDPVVRERALVGVPDGGTEPLGRVLAERGEVLARLGRVGAGLGLEV